MKILADKSELVNALSSVVGVTDTKSSMQILSNVLIDVSDSVVDISATNLNMSMSYLFKCEDSENGRITVPGKSLFAILKKMPSGNIKLQTKTKSSAEMLVISCKKSKFELLTLPADDYPEIKQCNFEDNVFFDTSLLSEMIRMVGFSISGDETRPHLNTLLFKGNNKKLLMVSTDGHRLSKVEEEIEDDYNFSMLIPRKSTGEIKKLCETGNKKIGMRFDEEKESAFFYVGDEENRIMFSTKILHSSMFPPYDQVIPKNWNNNIIANRNNLVDSLNRLVVLSDDNSKGISLDFSDGAMELHAANPQKGDGIDIVDIDYAGEEIKIGVNAKYVIDVLNAIDGEEVIFGLSGALDPIVVESESKKYIGVIMPMRI